MAKPNKEKKTLIQFDTSQEEIVFSDIAEINVTEDNVTFSFATKSKDGKTAKVSHKVYITIPHFVRLADVVYNLKTGMISELNQKTEDFIKAQTENKTKKK